MAATRENKSELEAMEEFAKQMWERYFKPKASEELLGHSLDGYKATVESNNEDGTLTVTRPFDCCKQTLKCPPALAENAQRGDQVLVVTMGDASNSFILCATDMQGFGSGKAGEKVREMDFTHLYTDGYFTVTTEHHVTETYRIARDSSERIISVTDSDNFTTDVIWPEEPTQQQGEGE